MKKLLSAILSGVVVGVGCVALFDVYLNPGRTFFMSAMETSEKWGEQLRRESDAPCYILEGSSDVRMSVDPAAMKEETGVRAINAGFNAGAGENINMVEALRFSRPGDTLVLFPLIPWRPSDDNDPGSVKFLIHHHGLEAFEKAVVELTPKQLAYAIRGNSSSIFQFLGKAVQGRPTSYKYTRTSTVHESGWAEIHTYPQPFKWRANELKDDKLTVFDYIRQVPSTEQKYREHGLRLVVQLPRAFRDISHRAQGAYNALYLVRQGIKVLKDPALGVETDRDLMADTDLHQNAKGAQPYSRTLARLLANEEYWTEAELVEILHSYGRNEDGTLMETSSP